MAARVIDLAAMRGHNLFDDACWALSLLPLSIVAAILIEAENAWLAFREWRDR